ncbi:MAG: rRNA maturation RNase YbeY [Acidobacteriota bacterium]|nr:rRNA maturation RNase YbeY [Acidobacteriota bacterium]
MALLFQGLPVGSALSADDKRELKKFATALSEQAGDGAAFTCLVTDDRELQRLNRSFLGHDYPTDVLSFPSGGDHGNLGEMAISLERAGEQAAEFGHTLLDEIRILMLHGFIHLTGLDHERDRGEMARAERKWRAALGLPATLIARTRAR